MKFRSERSPAIGLLLAVLTPMLIAAAMALPWPLFEPNIVTVFLIPVVVSGWYGGLAPGLLSVVISNYFYIEPYYPYGMPDLDNVTRVENQGA